MCYPGDSSSDMMTDTSTDVSQESLLLSTIQSSLNTTTMPNPPSSSSSTASAPCSPSTLIPEMSLDTIFLAGFLDCAQEAINYLTEMEKVSYADETIVGLRQHLHHRQHQIRTSPYSPGSRRERRNRQRKRSTTELRRSLSMDDLNTLNVDDSGMAADDEGYISILVDAEPNQNGVESDSEGEGEEDNVELVATEQAQQQQQDSRIPSLSDSVDSTLESDSEACDRELPDLAVLAQENPAIASAAHELLQLLEEELQENEGTDLSLLQSLCS